MDPPVVPTTDNISTLLQRPCFHNRQQQTESSPQAVPATVLRPSPFQSNLPISPPSIHPISENELFLRPRRTNDVTRGKALRIVDFVSRLRSTKEEKVLSYDENCRLTLTLQDTKPKLSTVTVEQYSIANLRIFYELLFSGKLSTVSCTGIPFLCH